MGIIAFQTNILALNTAMESAAFSAELFQKVRTLKSTASRFRLKE